MTRHRQTPANDEQAALDERQTSLSIWWLLSFLLILTGDHIWLMSKAAVLPAGRPAVLSPDNIWSPPWLELHGSGSWAHWPWMIIAFTGAAGIALLCQYISRSDSPGTALLAALAFSLGFREMSLIPAILMIGIRYFQDGVEEEEHARRSMTVVLLLLIAGVLISLEFGLLFLFWFALLIPQAFASKKPSNRRWLLGVGGAVLVMLAVAGLQSGFRATLFRPVNWIGLHSTAELMDSLAPVSFSGEHRWRDLLFVLLLGAFWHHSGRTLGSLKIAFPILLSFSLLGLLCTHYLWLSGVALALRPRSSVETRPTTFFHSLAKVAILLFCLMRVESPISFLRESFATDTLVPRRLDPAEWGTEGRVILTNLDRSHEWESPELREKFRLVINNRWEIFGGVYPEYAEVRRDLREMRDAIYLKDDNRFGGYLQQINKWDATLLVVDSDDLEAIRNLSLSPHWSLMGIDAESTVFGRAGDPGNRRQIELTGRTCLSLEWPNTRSQSLPPNVIAAASLGKLPRVAAVLNAIRLPYAALRLLPKSYHLNCEKVRARCYLELAHRCYRNTGTYSLLDQSRAIELIRSVKRKNSWTREEKESLIRSLNSLGIDGLSYAVFPGELSESGRVDDNPGGLSSFLECPESERRMRELTLRGQARAARQQLLNLSEDVRPFYALLMDPDGRSPEELAYLLHKLSQRPEFPERLLPECLFYIGCLAIEAGGREVAIQAISESEHRAPGSHLTPLRVMYLKQLQRP